MDDETIGIVFWISFFMFVYGFYSFTWLLKTFNLHKQWGIPYHQTGYIFIILLLISIAILFVPVEYNWTNLQGVNFLIYLSVNVLVLPPLYYFFLSREFWKPNRFFGERKMKNLWTIISEGASFLGGLIFLIVIIRFIFQWITIDFSTAFGNIEGIYHLALFFSLLQGLYSGYSKSFKESVVVFEEYKNKRYTLVIRSFAIDYIPFVWGSITNVTKVKKGSNEKFKYISYPTIFEFLNLGFKDTLGEIIALGDPIRYVPIEGIKNSYHTDETWRNDFINWADNAEYIISIPDNTSGLEYEISTIVNKGLLNKFYVFTPIEYKRNWITSKWVKYKKYINNDKKVNWKDYVSLLKKYGLTLKDEYVSGTIYGFKENGDSIILSNNLTKVEDYKDVFRKEFYEAKYKKKTTPNKG